MKRVIFTIMALLALMQNNSIYAQNETYVSEGVSIGKNEKGNGLSLNVNGLVVETATFLFLCRKIVPSAIYFLQRLWYNYYNII